MHQGTIRTAGSYSRLYFCAMNLNKKQKVKVLHVMEEIVINDTLVNAGFTKITEGVNLVNPVCMTMSSAATQFSKHLNL